ncbi:hypothetical protein BHE74_00033319 [Ensete ventricosum]|nr:hypothetical protein BHE74_00033319 [Ensete ventricosum]
MDIVEAIIGQRKRWDLDGRRRYNGYSIRSIGCSVSVALQKKMLATSKGKVRSLGGRCWEGKERLTGDQIWSRSCREVEHCTSAARALRSYERRRSSRSGGRWSPRRLLAESAATTPTAP